MKAVQNNKYENVTKTPGLAKIWTKIQITSDTKPPLKDENDPEKIEQLIGHGNYICKELEALYMLKKYRTLKRRYYDTEDDLEKMKLKQFEEVVKKST
jgi:hypothetical protein